ncbi:hypothetical protein PR048_001290 [Dryococelus australis]|uniref:Uncharacterized protein n=1 Tax=Dryococelus australis TaxID=614101 RepID=A0ABQ9IH32_9NEOP|nr:hypothetical protein PR048_001290 [Dryococelus australis]
MLSIGRFAEQDDGKCDDASIYLVTSQAGRSTDMLTLEGNWDIALDAQQITVITTSNINLRRCDFANYMLFTGATVSERLASSLLPSRSGFNLRPGHSGFLHVGIVPDDAGIRRVFSGISRSPAPFHSSAAPYPLQSPSSALKTSMLRAVQIYSLTHSICRSMIFEYFRNQLLGMLLPVSSYVSMGTLTMACVLLSWGDRDMRINSHRLYTHSTELACSLAVDNVIMEQRRNEWAGETGDARENPPTSGIVRHDSHMRKSGVTRPGIEPVPALIMLPEADSKRPLTTAGHTHLHVFLVRCADDKKTPLSVFHWPISGALFNIFGHVHWLVKGVSATIFHKVLEQFRSCTGSMFEDVIRHVVQLRPNHFKTAGDFPTLYSDRQAASTLAATKALRGGASCLIDNPGARLPRGLWWRVVGGREGVAVADNVTLPWWDNEHHYCHPSPPHPTPSPTPIFSPLSTHVQGIRAYSSVNFLEPSLNSTFGILTSYPSTRRRLYKCEKYAKGKTTCHICAMHESVPHHCGDGQGRHLATAGDVVSLLLVSSFPCELELTSLRPQRHQGTLPGLEVLLLDLQCHDEVFPTVGMEQRQNLKAGETGCPRENPPTGGIVRHDYQRRKILEQPRRETNPVRQGERRVV